MSTDHQDAAVVREYFAAMRQGAAAAERLFALFTADAVYSEPFSGRDPAVGIEAIRERFAAGWSTPLPDLELEILSLTVDGATAHARWECRSPALPGPQLGEDHYRFVDGRIARLDVRLVPAEDDDGDEA